jgi:peptidoglycan hydrolase-like protein with peptidoglycan-binding domain
MFTPRLASLIAGLLVVLLMPAMPAQAAGQKKQNELTKEEILEAEQRLSELGYWTGPVDGMMDPASRQALIAFQKVERRKRAGLLTSDELIALRTARRPTPREAGSAHVEIDLYRQVLFYVDETGQVAKILPVSTGHGRAYNDNGQKGVARTPSGTFRVYKKINGWRRSALGLLYYPSYIIGGYAIHGSQSVPTFPASHGCIRIPMFAAVEFSKLATMGMVVIVYNKT